jgi:cysteine desulfurase
MEQSAQRALLLYSSPPSGSSSPFGNPSSIHWAGRKAKAALDDARDALARALSLDDPDSLLFTGSATESINTALKGFFFHHHAAGRAVRFVSTRVEHEATLESLKFLETLGARVELLPVDAEGELSLASLEAALKASGKDEAVMVSLLAANNETGVVFPWEEAAALAGSHGALFHLDAVQAFGKLAGFSLRGRNVLASFSAHKIGGPKGVGALVVPKGAKLVALLHGGAQERKRRAGTVNVAGIASFGAAATAAAARDLAAVERRRASLEARVLERIPGARLQGARAARRVANTSNFLFDGVRGEGLVMGLDLEGFAVSSGSACNSGSILPSHVLLAMGFDKAAAQSAVRVSLAPETTDEEVALFVDALEKVVSRIRSLSHT